MGKKRKMDVNVSQAIRDILDVDPDAKPAQIVSQLKSDHNVEVTAQYVSTIKSNERKRERSAVSTEFESLLMAKRFVQQVGGDVDAALRLLEDYKLLFADQASNARV